MRTSRALFFLAICVHAKGADVGRKKQALGSAKLKSPVLAAEA